MITIYHNNKCSKSRECLRIIKEKKLDYMVVEYLKVEFNLYTIKKIVTGIKGYLNDIIRVKDNNIKGFDIDFNNKKQIIKILFENKSCMQRPIIFNGKEYILCRPPEKVLNYTKE